MAKVTMSVSQFRRVLRVAALFASTDAAREGIHSVYFERCPADRANGAGADNLRIVLLDVDSRISDRSSNGCEWSGSASYSEDHASFALPGVLAALAAMRTVREAAFPAYRQVVPQQESSGWMAETEEGAWWIDGDTVPHGLRDGTEITITGSPDDQFCRVVPS